METDLTEEIINHLKNLHFLPRAETRIRYNCRLPKSAATNSEARMSWRFSNFWRNQSATSQRGKKMQGYSNQCRYNLVQWLWLWWLCCMTQLCLSSSHPCGWELGTQPELASTEVGIFGWGDHETGHWGAHIPALGDGEMPSKPQFSSKRTGLQSNLFFWCKGFS